MQDFREHFIPAYMEPNGPNGMTVVEILSDDTGLVYNTDYSVTWATTVTTNATQNPDAIRASIIINSFNEVEAVVVNGQLIPTQDNGWIDFTSLYAGDTIVTAEDLK